MAGKPPPERQCTGDSKRRPGERCEAWAMKGKDVCYHHGGKTPAGVASPQFRHGRRSKDIPTRLSGRYEEALADASYIELRDEVALLDARLGDVLGRVDTGESGRWIRDVRDAFKSFEKAEKGGVAKLDEIEEARSELRKLLSGGVLDYAAWDEIYGLIEQRRKLSETERKRMVAANQMVTSQQAMTFVAAVIGAVKKHVTDRDALAAISADLAALTATSHATARA